MHHLPNIRSLDSPAGVISKVGHRHGLLLPPPGLPLERGRDQPLILVPRLERHFVHNDLSFVFKYLNFVGSFPSFRRVLLASGRAAWTIS